MNPFTPWRTAAPTAPGWFLVECDARRHWDGRAWSVAIPEECAPPATPPRRDPGAVVGLRWRSYSKRFLATVAREGERPARGPAVRDEQREPPGPGWIPWTPGDCPVAEEARVTVWTRCGGIFQGTAAAFDWWHTFGRTLDPMAYLLD